MKESARWIRPEREQLFFGGITLACLIASMVTSYWYSLDKTAVKPNIILQGKKMSRAAEYRKIKETQPFAADLNSGGTVYYKLEEKSTLPKIPDLKPDYEDN